MGGLWPPDGRLSVTSPPPGVFCSRPSPGINRGPAVCRAPESSRPLCGAPTAERGCSCPGLRPVPVPRGASSAAVQPSSVASVRACASPGWGAPALSPHPHTHSGPFSLAVLSFLRGDVASSVPSEPFFKDPRPTPHLCAALSPRTDLPSTGQQPPPFKNYKTLKMFSLWYNIYNTFTTSTIVKCTARWHWARSVSWSHHRLLIFPDGHRPR